MFSIKDIYIKHYGFETRLQNECFMLCVGKHGLEDYIKKYKHPMCQGYLYFDFLKKKNSSHVEFNFGVSEKLNTQVLKKFLVEHCDISQDNIEIFCEYCHFINIKEND